jgi:hypothetical protein
MTTKLTLRGETFNLQSNLVGNITVGELFETFNLIEFFNTMIRYDKAVPFDTMMQKTSGGVYYLDIGNDEYLVFEEEESDGTDVHVLSQMPGFIYKGITS